MLLVTVLLILFFIYFLPSESPISGALNMSPMRIRRAPAIHGGGHTSSPLTVQTWKTDKGYVGGSYGDLTALHGGQSTKMRELMNATKKGKAATLPHTLQVN